MNICILLTPFFLLAVTVIAEKESEEHNANKVLKECMEETSVPENFVSLFLRGDMDFGDENAKCFVKCFGEKMEFCDENFKITNIDTWIVGKNGITKEKVKKLS